MSRMDESPWGLHEAELGVLSCVDDRVHEAAREYVRTRLSPRFFWFAMPGGALAVNQGASWLLPALSIPVGIGMKRIALINHTDCAAFSRFPDRQQELQAHRDSLSAARAVLQKEFPGVEVMCVLLQGRWHAEEV